MLYLYCIYNQIVMKKLVYPLAAVVILSLSAFTMFSSIDWKVAEGYNIEFDGKNASGTFSKLQGDIKFDANNLSASSFNMTVDVASINTGNGMKNRHATSDNWFDAEKYPNITFVSEKISKGDKGYVASGKLTIRDVTKTVDIPFSFNSNTFKGNLMIHRVDYGLGSTKGMQGKGAGKDIEVTISVPVTQ